MKCANHPTLILSPIAACAGVLCALNASVTCTECSIARPAWRAACKLLCSVRKPALARASALALGFIPGVGAIYNGQIVKAMIQVLIFGSLIALGDRVGSPMDTIFGLGAAAFYFYMVIDSYQTAKAKQLGQRPPEWFGLGDMKMNAPIGRRAAHRPGSVVPAG